MSTFTWHVPVSFLSTALLVLDLAIVVVLVPKIIVQRRESAATLAWVFFILLLPIIGALSFHFLGTRRLRRRRVRRARTRAKLAPGSARVDAILHAYDFAGDDGPTEALARRVFSVERSTATSSNELELLSDGAAAFSAIEQAVLGAERYVHLMYYIFRPDATGRRLLDLLTRRAREGVEVRLLVDAVGSWRLGARHLAALRAAGGRAAEFLPLNLMAKPFSINFRNHRKILVVDGRIAFTGGMNVGDEYRGRRTRLGDWRDALVRVRGPAALRLQEVFADDWHYSTDEECIGPAYIPPPERAGGAAVQIVASGPDSSAETVHRSVFTAITGASQRVWLTTPYFLPDRAILVALLTAAQRGVDVRLLLPGVSDSRLVFQAGRSNYDELLGAGVRIFEYRRGMLHAKTMVVDEAMTTIGSANMDMRSFVLNWEANLVAFDTDFARSLAMVFLRDCAASREVKHPYTRSAWQRFQEASCYLLSPLL